MAVGGGVGVAGIAGAATTASGLPAGVVAGVVSVAQPKTNSKIEKRIASFVFGLSNIPTSCPAWVAARFLELALCNYIAVRVGGLPFTADIGHCFGSVPWGAHQGGYNLNPTKQERNVAC